VPTRIYLTGGATAVLEGWRASTVDVDLRIEPDIDSLLRELPALKEAVGVTIELASPPDFIPELPGWRDRSPFVFREGNVDIHHFDFYSQAFFQDRARVQPGPGGRPAHAGVWTRRPTRLRQLYDTIEPELFRYPAIDPAAFRRKLAAALR
jgi:hypothetical protein